MTIETPVINTFNRVGIDYKPLLEDNNQVTVYNRFSGESCVTSKLVAELISWVYKTNDAMDSMSSKVRISDFDRVRYFIAKIDPEAYSTCID